MLHKHNTGSFTNQGWKIEPFVFVVEFNLINMFQYMSPVIAVSAALAIYGDFRGPRELHYVCKPTTTFLILVMTTLQQPNLGTSASYQWLIGSGLVMSLAGDVLLMLPKDKFIQGLGSFLLAHLLYIVAMIRPLDFSLEELVLLAPFLVYGGLVLTELLLHLPKDLTGVHARKVTEHIPCYQVPGLFCTTQVGRTRRRASLTWETGVDDFLIIDSHYSLDFNP